MARGEAGAAGKRRGQQRARLRVQARLSYIFGDKAEAKRNRQMADALEPKPSLSAEERRKQEENDAYWQKP